MTNKEQHENLDKLWEYLVKDFVNESDYPTGTAKVYWALNMLDKTSDEDITEVLDIDIEDTPSIRNRFENGCDKWLGA